jgi:hypothetical protein
MQKVSLGQDSPGVSAIGLHGNELWLRSCRRFAENDHPYPNPGGAGSGSSTPLRFTALL